MYSKCLKAIYHLNYRRIFNAWGKNFKVDVVYLEAITFAMPTMGKRIHNQKHIFIDTGDLWKQQLKTSLK